MATEITVQAICKIDEVIKKIEERGFVLDEILVGSDAYFSTISKGDIEKLSYQQVFDLFIKYNDNFVPRLSDDVDIENYSKKVSDNALFAVYKNEDNIIGFVAYYLNLEFKSIDDFKKSYNLDFASFFIRFVLIPKDS